MSWLSPRAVRRRRLSTRSARPQLLELEGRINPTSILQYHVDSQSDGVNNSETILTPSNVNETQFGKLYQIQVTGQVYAEPLVETGVDITVGPNQGMHDVVFVATEHDQLYAFDADYNPATQTTSQQLLWQRSFLSDSLNTNPGDLLAGATSVTSVPQSAVISSDITPEIGITGTPVIDPNTATLYVATKTAETVSGTVHYVQRLYAINIQNGTDQTAPFLLGDTTYNGSTYTNYASETSAANSAAENAKASSQIWTYGTGNSGESITDPYTTPASGKQIIQFNALREAVRSGLDLVNGVVYMAWASHGDNGPYHGWMVGISAYSPSTPSMKLTGVLNTTPNGGLGGIWQAGGEVTYADGFFYFETGNGTFDGQNGTGTGGEPTAPAPGPITGLNNAGFPINGDYADSFVKVAIDPNSTALSQNITTGSATETANSDGWGLKVADYFTPFNQNFLNSQDLDVGSSAAVVVPDYNTTIGGTNQFASAAEPQLLVGSGKEGVIYLIDRDGAHTGVNADVPAYTGSMGGFGLSNHNLQPTNTTNQLSGSLDSAAFYNGQMYYVPGYNNTGAKAFTFVNGSFNTTPASISPDVFAFAGSTPFISANNGTNGIVWDIDRGTNQLRAYNANSYAQEIYNSGQAPNNRDALGAAVKFQVTTVANGRVYVGSGTGDPNNFLVVYGELAPPTDVPNDPSNLIAQPASSSQITLSWTDNSVSPNVATSFTILRSVDGGAFSTLATAFGTNYADTTVTSGHAYEYKVYAVDGFGSSNNPTNVATASVPAAGAHTIDYSAGFTTANTTAGSTHGGFQFNGATQATLVTANVLRLTTNTGNQARSVFYTYPSDPSGHSGKMYIGSFTTTFVYDLTSNGNGPADGVTFTIQNSSSGLGAIGAGGGALAYQGITPSVALGINVYSGNALGTEILQNGVVDENFSETNINTQTLNAPITITLSYAAGVLTVVEQQTLNSVVETDTKTLAINLPALLGSDYDIVGFTGATGGADSTQNINSWTFDQGVVPQPPTGLSAVVTGYTGGANGTVPVPVPLGANLTWNAVTDTPSAGGTVSYEIFRSLNSTGPFVQIGTSTTNSFSDNSALAPATSYYYEVEAVDTYSSSTPSASFSITTPNLAATATGSQLTNITSTSISFQWQNNANNATGYLILRRIGGSGTFTILTTLPPNNTNVPNIMSYTDNTVSPGTAYDYHIQSYNLAGYSDFAGVSATTPSTSPTNLVATTGSGSIGLSWTPVSGSGVTYNVYRGTTPGGEGATPIATGLTSPSYTDSSLSYATTYYYEVTAVSGGTESPDSNEASAFASGPTTTTLQVSPNPATTTQTVTLKATIASAGGTPAAGSVVFYDGGNPLATVSVNASGIATYSTTFANGAHSLTAIYAGTSGFAPSSTTQPTQEVIGPPVVSSIQVNGGSAERSEVRTISVTFSGPVLFTGGNANAAAAFQLQHVEDATNVANLAAAVSTNALGQTVVTLTFTANGNSSAEIDPESVMNGGAASLADGRYQLTVLSANVTDSNGVALDGNGDGTAGDNYVSPADTQGGGPGQLHLFRLFGDTDGSGIVDQLDLAQFRSANNSSSGSSAYLAYLDADNSGTIDQFDLAQFRARNNSSIF